MGDHGWRRGFAWRRATLVVIASLTVFAGLTGLMAQAQTTPVPPGLKDEIKSIDADLNAASAASHKALGQLARREGDYDVFQSLEHQVGSARHSDLLDFFPHTYGLAFGSFLVPLACVDRAVNAAAAGKDAAKAQKDYARAAQCIDELKRELSNGTDVPADLSNALDNLKNLLAEASKDVRQHPSAFKGDASGGERILHRHRDAVTKAKHDMLKPFPPVFGASFDEAFRQLECFDEQLDSADALIARYLHDAGPFPRFAPATRAKLKRDLQAIADHISAARACKEKLRAALIPVEIDEFETWAHNVEIGYSNICINVRTTPPQASISATITGPQGYHASLPKHALDQPDGSIQIVTTITVAGDYTKTLAVYDKTGKETASVVKTFTVDAPPKDGPAPPFGRPCVKPTQPPK